MERAIRADRDTFLLIARAYVNYCLAGSYTDEGVEQWWHRERTQLEARSPEQVWKTDPLRVIKLAESLGETMGT